MHSSWMYAKKGVCTDQVLLSETGPWFGACEIPAGLEWVLPLSCKLGDYHTDQILLRLLCVRSVTISVGAKSPNHFLPRDMWVRVNNRYPNMYTLAKLAIVYLTRSEGKGTNPSRRYPMQGRL